MTTINKREFLLTEFSKLLKNLSPELEGNFGLMTPQHMVEHLINSMDSATVKYEGERKNPPTERQLAMQKFIKSGSVITHRPSDKTKADLPELKYASYEEAVSNVRQAVQRFYDFIDANPNYMPYASFLGEVPHEDVEFFHYMHIRYHLWQFGLLEQYP